MMIELKNIKGKKTYIVAVAMICYALGGVVADLLDWNTAIQTILTALAIMGLRIGIKSKQ